MERGDPSAIMIKIEPWFVPQAAKNQEHAIGFYKYMTSKEKAQQFVTEKGTLMAVKGANQWILPMHLPKMRQILSLLLRRSTLRNGVISTRRCTKRLKRISPSW
ncbi:MAG: hypothetical protein R2688_01085 [Fimbriimonadaceae bacterium]